MRLFRVAQRFNVEIQPQLILLHKTLFNIEGLGRQLYPQLDLWKTAHPVLRRWMDEQIGPRAMLSDLRENLPQIREAMKSLPLAIQRLASQDADDLLPDMEPIRAELRAQRMQRYWLTAAATGGVSGSLFIALGPSAWLGGGLLTLGAVAAWMARPSSA